MKIENMKQEHLEGIKGNYENDQGCCSVGLLCEECAFDSLCTTGNRVERYNKVCAELERRQKVCPFKKGDKVIVSDWGTVDYQRTFLTYIPELEAPYVVTSGNGKYAVSYKHCKPLSEKIQVTKKEIAELLGKPDVEIEVIE